MEHPVQPAQWRSNRLARPERWALIELVIRGSKEDSVKVAILAGGFGSRLAEETEIKPKPMVEIGGRPFLWHILMHYAF
jgi:hypothetical protein